MMEDTATDRRAGRFFDDAAASAHLLSWLAAPVAVRLPAAMPCSGASRGRARARRRDPREKRCRPNSLLPPPSRPGPCRSGCTSPSISPTSTWRAAGACPAPAARTYPDVAHLRRSPASPSAAASTCCSPATAPACRAPGREPRRRGALGRQLAAPGSGAAGGGDVAGDEASRLRRHLFHHLHASLLPGAAVQLARPRHRRAASPSTSSPPRGARITRITAMTSWSTTTSATTGWRSSSTSAARCGTASSPTRCCGITRPARSAIRPRCTTSSIAADSSRSAGR